jgi:hypothetical protein
LFIDSGGFVVVVLNIKVRCRVDQEGVNEGVEEEGVTE